MNNSNLKTIPEQERPYEKCLEFGAQNLSDTDLLAILLRTGTAGMNVLELSRYILYESGENGLLNLHDLKREDFMEIKGIGKVKAIQLECLGELTKRMARTSEGEKLTFSQPFLVADYFMEELRHEEQENLLILMLNSKCNLIKKVYISKGSVNQTVITPREIYLEALRCKAVNIIMLHNHPSGDPSPSQDDIFITDRIREAGDLLGVHLLDHIVIGDNCYYSFSENDALLKG